MIPSEGRRRALLEADDAICSELSLESHFQRLVTTTAELMGARYPALGVIERSGRQLERFSGARRSAVRVGAFALRSRWG